MNVITDLYLISIPVPMLWQSSLKPVKKIGLIVLFSGGLFVVACAILRCALIVTVSKLFPAIPLPRCAVNVRRSTTNRHLYV